MPRGTKRVKMAHDSKAAYAASQPLFDALRFAVNGTSEQHAHLSNARDIVQQTHVKLADSLSNGDMNQHARYIDSAIKAWRSTTESYAQIFNALAQASAAEPSEGKPMREGHESFVKMAGMAAEANSVAKSFVLYEEKQSGQPQWVDQNEDEDEDQDQDESQSASNASSENKAHQQPQTSPAATKRAQLQPGTSSKEAKRKKKVEESREEHRKKILALRANKKNVQGEAARVGAKIGSSTRDESSSVPGAANVEYEDVSAEVEARLKAKQAKKEVAKKEKKRKRDSVESHDFHVREDDIMEKPAKKRSRSNGVGDGVEMVDVKEKRKKDGFAGDAGDGGRRSKKTKTKE